MRYVGNKGGQKSRHLEAVSAGTGAVRATGSDAAQIVYTKPMMPSIFAVSASKCPFIATRSALSAAHGAFFAFRVSHPTKWADVTFHRTHRPCLGAASRRPSTESHHSLYQYTVLTELPYSILEFELRLLM